MNADAIFQAASNVGAALSARGWMLACAESCTGGGLAFAITAVPGSSAWFDRGWVTYSNTAKFQLLGVPQIFMEGYGAVSEPVALAMTTGALCHSSANVGVAITGIAGPDGGSPDKPVGTVWIAWGVRDRQVVARSYVFAGDRAAVREQAILVALDGVVDACSGAP